MVLSGYWGRGKIIPKPMAGLEGAPEDTIAYQSPLTRPRMCHFLSLPGTFRLHETPLNPYETGFGDVKPPQVGFHDLGPKRTDQCDKRPLLCDGKWIPGPQEEDRRELGARDQDYRLGRARVRRGGKGRKGSLVSV